jgi:hypothetical protein
VEVDEDGLVRLDDGAARRLELARPAVERCADRAVFEVEARALERGRVLRDRRLRRGGARERLLGRALGDRALLLRALDLLRGGPRVLRERAVAREIGLGDLHRGLERSRVELEQEIAGLDVGAFLERDLEEHPRDLRLQRDRRDRVHDPDGEDLLGDVGARSRRGRHGDRGRARSGALGRGGGRGLRSAGGEEREDQEGRSVRAHPAILAARSAV